MSSSTKEISQLQLRIVEFENQEKDENNKSTSINHSFIVINDLLNEKKQRIKRSRYFLFQLLSNMLRQTISYPFKSHIQYFTNFRQ